MFKRFLSLILVASSLMLATATPAQAAGELAKITSSGELRIGYIPSPPVPPRIRSAEKSPVFMWI
ncbi:hypothetical protein SODG_006125 [Sodalis praecaptivus]